jgi:signal transduction histidine kinase
MPLWVKGQVIGVWSLGNCQVEAYNSDSTTTAQGLADQLALAIDNTYLTEQAYQEIETRKQVQAALEVERASLTQRVMDRTADLERANLELAQAFRSKDEFLINMSYELRTPLNAILGMAEILQEEVYGPLSQKQEKSVDTIKKSGEHLLALLNDILDFSKIEAGQVK